MKNIAFVNSLHQNAYSLVPLVNHRSSVQEVQAFLESLPDLEKTVPIVRSQGDLALYFPSEAGQEALILEEDRQDLLFQALRDRSEGYDHCFYLFGDTPFLDRKLFEDMYRKHQDYYADYSFADGYPLGLSLEIFRPSVLAELSRAVQVEALPNTRENLFNWIQKDINSYDIETSISLIDMRLKRIELFADRKDRLEEMRGFAAAGIRKAEDFTERHQELEQYCRTLPAYVQVQIHSGCPQSCSYCPYPQMNSAHREEGESMPLPQVLDLAHRVEAFAPEARLSLSLWGEPALHRDIRKILLSLLTETSLRLVVETSGLGWGDLSTMEEALSSERIDWILSLDALSPQMYRQLRGEGQEEALAMAERLLELNPQHSWIQAVRMKENEEDIEQFYYLWKEKTANVIIQKYNSYGDRLPDRRVTDLSPLKRFPCWHLKREMAILADGSVTLCQEDDEQILGNVFNSDLPSLWTKGEEFFKAHREGRHPGICGGCDEYYSFNF